MQNQGFWVLLIRYLSQYFLFLISKQTLPAYPALVTKPKQPRLLMVSFSSQALSDSGSICQNEAAPIMHGFPGWSPLTKNPLLQLPSLCQFPHLQEQRLLPHRTTVLRTSYHKFTGGFHPCSKLNSSTCGVSGSFQFHQFRSTSGPKPLNKTSFFPSTSKFFDQIPPF